MRVLIGAIILALGLSVFIACSSGGSRPTPQTPSAVERLATTRPDVPSGIANLRIAMRKLLTNPFFATESLCRSIRGVSNEEASNILMDVAADYGHPLYIDPEVSAAGGEILKEECERMYP